MWHELDALLATLAERIGAGESIATVLLPDALREHPEVLGMLRFARVAQVLDRHQETPEPEAVAAPAAIGPWRVLRLLGRGGMGEVWLGERSDGVVDQQVAIKRVRGASPAFVRRLLAERRILARLSHPNIARFIDAGVDLDAQPWMALEYVQGGDLSTWCSEPQPDLRARLELFLKICSAVDHAHRLLVVHRDLKPGNVLVDAQGEPHLLDFGVAKLLDEEAGETTLAALTPVWAAPEQLRGEPVSTATDVYALGLLLCRLLSGALPASRARGDLASLMAELGEEDTQRPSRLARAGEGLPYPAERLVGDLDAIFAKALRPEPADRYGSAAALAEDVERHLQSRPLGARQRAGTASHALPAAIAAR
jgi:serine/threonine protein kinase